MDLRYQKTVTVLPSQVDPSGRLGMANAFDLFMDTATEAAGRMGVGWDMLIQRGLFWITVKARVAFIDPPKLLEAVEVETWPAPPGDMRCDRFYRIAKDGATLAAGRTEWAIVDVRAHRPLPLGTVLPQGLDYPSENPSPEPFPTIDEDFPDAPYHVHAVSALDIDMARHMNNVAYVRAIINSFSVAEWRRLNVRQMDVIFRASAVEGNVIEFRKRETEGHVDIRGSIGGDVTSVLARLRKG